ncbi:MAG: hypothetical protein A4E65_02550 [Syntrophorhabdus sp. PtaU1.Bin153]|nr:MAG: hypothetical protein A4E65_02550 [Syntrophorhabdus sp. PtaU1.Bin153]
MGASEISQGMVADRAHTRKTLIGGIILTEKGDLTDRAESFRIAVEP